MRCDFCNNKSKGVITIDDRWNFRNCNSLECKRKQTIIIKILVGDLSNRTILAMAKIIPQRELENITKKELEEKQDE